MDNPVGREPLEAFLFCCSFTRIETPEPYPVYLHARRGPWVTGETDIQAHQLLGWSWRGQRVAWRGEAERGHLPVVLQGRGEATGNRPLLRLQYHGYPDSVGVEPLRFPGADLEDRVFLDVIVP